MNEEKYKMRNRLEEIYQKLEEEGKVEELSQEEMNKIKADINTEMRKFDMPFRMRNAKSNESARRTYVFKLLPDFF